jgi:hypothetical protein
MERRTRRRRVTSASVDRERVCQRKRAAVEAYPNTFNGELAIKQSAVQMRVLLQNASNQRATATADLDDVSKRRKIKIDGNGCVLADGAQRGHCVVKQFAELWVDGVPIELTGAELLRIRGMWAKRGKERRQSCSREGREAHRERENGPSRMRISR